MTDIAELEEQMVEMENGLSELEAEIDYLKTEGQSLEDKLDGLGERISDLEEILSIDNPAAPATEPNYRHAPDETTNAVIRNVLHWCQANEKDTVPLRRFRRAVEQEGYTRNREKKKYTRRAARHGPFRPHSDIASTWIIDREAAETNAEAEAAEP